MSSISALHFYWTFGGQFGFKSAGPILEGEKKFEPGRGITFIVALLLGCLAFLAYQLTWPYQIFSKIIPYAGYLTSIVFIVRAVGDFNYLGFFKKIYNSNFATLDTRVFSPLCLLLGISYGFLAAQY